MGQRQARLVEDLVAVDEQVEIDRSRPETLSADAPQAGLDVKEPRKELARRQFGLHLDGAVQEWPLLDGPDGLGFTQPGDRYDLDSVLGSKTVERSS
jgi:hypothetical protein